MAANITGIVFHDLNHNGQYNTGEPGIPEVYVTLYSSATGCVTTQTDANGNYLFSVAAAGLYTVYEPVSSPTACPPTVFIQPPGFTMSNGPRKLAVTVTADQVSNGTTIGNQNFSHDTVSTPLVCSTQMIQFVGRPTSWYNINIVTGEPTLQGTLSPSDEVNAIGYNTLDNYIYGYDQTTNNLVRVDQNGMLIQLPRPIGLPTGNYNVGTFDSNGFLYLFINDTGRFYTVDLRPESATFMKLVSPANGYTEQTSNFGTALTIATNISDWVWLSSDGNLYGVQRNGVLTRISPLTGQVTSLATTAPNPNASFGAMAIDSTGTMYAIANNDGTIYKYVLTGNTAVGTAFSRTFFNSFNDGTMCPFAAVLVDYGDAPDTGRGTGPGNYNTLLTNNGPRHELTNTLTLGTQVTAETDAYQNPTATGDDLTKGIPDDGLTVPLSPFPISGGSYTLPVTVQNQTGQMAHLYGWIDFNQNGLFEANEAAPVLNIPSAAGTQTVSLVFTPPAGAVFTAGNTFVRLRVTTDDLVQSPDVQDSRSVGPASDGEVEDYILAIASVADLAVLKTADRSSLSPGDEIIYTIVITNNGPDAATDTILTDTVPNSIPNSQYSFDGGSTWLPWIGSLSLGTLDPGASVTVLLRGTYDGTATNAVVNLAQVTTSASDPDLSNNTSTVITPLDTSSDLSIVKTADSNPAVAGKELIYTLVVTNNGPDAAQNVQVSDSVSSILLNPEFSLDGGGSFAPWVSSYDLGTLQPGESVMILIRGTVDPSASGSIFNRAEVTSTTPDPNPDNNEDSVEIPIEGQADLSVFKQGFPKPVRPGELLTYQIVTSNAGPSAAENVKLSDILPPELENGEFSLDDGVSWQPWFDSYLIGRLEPGSVITVYLRGIVRPFAQDVIINTAEAISLTPDPDPGNNSYTDVTPVEVSADLAVKKTSEPNPVPAGGELTYQITLTNFGPSDAQDVLLQDDLPPYLQNGEYSLDGGGTWQP